MECPAPKVVASGMPELHHGKGAARGGGPGECLNEGLDVLGQLAEQLAEEGGQQGAAQVEPLVGVVVPVVLRAPPQRAQQQPVHHVAQEERLHG